MAGNKHYNWKGGRRLNKSNGYIEVHCPDHPRANYKGLVYEHRLIMEKTLGRFLTKEERIHHVNHNRTDNRIDNLRLFSNHSEHLKYHWWLRRQEKSKP